MENTIVVGRELDAMIAETVMGWRRSGPVFRFYANDAGFLDLEGRRRRAPYYSTDIAAAWLVVERLRQQGVGLDLAIHDVETAYFVTLTFGSAEAFANAETAPLAICLAALKLFDLPEE